MADWFEPTENALANGVSGQSAGYAGGVVTMIAMDSIKTSPKDWTHAAYLLLGTIGVSLVLAVFMRESFGAGENE